MQRHDPTPEGDERELLLQYLDYHRATLLIKCEGLDAQQLAQRIPSSELTLGGLLKHLAFVEDSWLHSDFLDADLPEPWLSAPGDDDRDWEFHTAASDTPEALRELYLAAIERTSRIVNGAQLGQLAARPNKRGERVSLRWILLHLIEETARHNGHADLLREAIDGQTGE